MRWSLFVFLIFTSVLSAQDYKSCIIPFDSNPSITSLKSLENNFIISSRNFIGQDGGTSTLIISENLSHVQMNNYLGVAFSRKSPFIFGNNKLIGIGDKTIGEGGHESLILNDQLNEIFRNTYDSFSGDSGLSSSLFLDNHLYGIIVDVYAPLDRDITLIKIDTLGNRVWLKKMEFNFDYKHNYDVTTSSDGNILLATEYLENSEYKVHVSKISTDGDIIWESYLTLPKYFQSGIWIAELSNGNIVTTKKIDKSLDGPYLSEGHAPYPPQLVWTDADGNEIKDYFFKSKPHYADLSINRLFKGKGDYFFGIGNRNHQEDTQKGYYGWIFKMDNEGNILWNRKYYHTAYQDGNRYHKIDYLLELDNGDIITAGTATLPGVEGEVWVMRLNSEGCLGDDCGDPISSTGEITTEIPTVILFPNPSTGVFHLDEFKTFDYIRVTDISGKIVHQINAFSGSSLNLSAVENGNYWIQFIDDGIVEGISALVIAR